MHIETRKEIIGLNEDGMCTDHRVISVNYRPVLSTAAALKVSADSFRIFVS